MYNRFILYGHNKQLCKIQKMQSEICKPEFRIAVRLLLELISQRTDFLLRVVTCGGKLLKARNRGRSFNQLLTNNYLQSYIKIPDKTTISLYVCLACQR